MSSTLQTTFSILPTVVDTANIHLHVKPTHASLTTARQDKRQDAHNISDSGDRSTGSKVLAWKQNSEGILSGFSTFAEWWLSCHGSALANCKKYYNQNLQFAAEDRLNFRWSNTSAWTRTRVDLLEPSSVTMPSPSALFCLSNAFKSRTLRGRRKSTN